MQYSIFKYPRPLIVVLWPWHWRVCPCKFSTCIINVSILKMDIVLNSLQHVSLKYSWPLTWVPLKDCLSQFSAWINVILLKMGISHSLLYKVVQHIIFNDLWPWWCDRNIENNVHINYHIKLCHVASGASLTFDLGDVTLTVERLSRPIA